LWQRVHDYLFSGRTERFAFLYCGISRHTDGVSLLASDVALVPDEEVEFDEGFRLTVGALVEVTNKARKLGVALVEVHYHPFSGKRVTFSSTDRVGFGEFVPYILDDLPDRPYGALVLGDQSVDGVLWERSVDNPQPIEEILVEGKNLNRLSITSKSTNKDRRSRPEVGPRGRTNRQILAIGLTGQASLEGVRVGIVGLGGLGSHVAQQLTYLGVRHFILIDGDRVDPTSLNRMVMAEPRDVGRMKVDVIGEQIERVAGRKNVSVKRLATDVRDVDALEGIKDVDVLFGCVDNDGARLVLNELACAYLIPYFDLAVGLASDNDAISEAGGRIAVVLPTGPCLLCAREVDLKQASDDLASEEELMRRRLQGYAGPAVSSPSVVSLNGVIASVAAQEFLAFVSKIRPVRTFTVYDMMEHERSPVVSRLVAADPDCIACASKGTGDKTWIERYSSRKSPASKAA